MDNKGFINKFVLIVALLAIIGVIGYFGIEIKSKRSSSFLMDKIAVKEIAAGVASYHFAWSPTDENVFVFNEPYGRKRIRLYKIIDNKIQEIAQFDKGMYQGPRWSKSGTHIIATKDKGENVIWPLSIVSINIKDGVESLLAGPIDKNFQYQEVIPCVVDYIIDGQTQFQRVNIPSCVPKKDYKPYAYYFNDADKLLSGPYNIFYSENGDSRQMTTLSPSRYGIVLDPNGNYYIEE